METIHPSCNYQIDSRLLLHAELQRLSFHLYYIYASCIEVNLMLCTIIDGVAHCVGHFDVIAVCQACNRHLSRGTAVV